MVNAPMGNTVSTAELTVVLLLALARHIPAADASLRQGEWDRKAFLGVEVRGKTVGLVGLGQVGFGGGPAAASDGDACARRRSLRPGRTSAQWWALSWWSWMICCGGRISYHYIPCSPMKRAG